MVVITGDKCLMLDVLSSVMLEHITGLLRFIQTLMSGTDSHQLQFDHKLIMHRDHAALASVSSQVAARFMR